MSERRKHRSADGLPAIRENARAPSARQLRVGEELRHVLAGILDRHELRDPDLQGVLITVTEVRMSPDLRAATAFVMPLGGERIEEILAALRRSRGYLRSQVAPALGLRYAPDLRFELDRSFEHASRITALLQQPQVRRDLDASTEEEESGEPEDVPSSAPDASQG